MRFRDTPTSTHRTESEPETATPPDGREVDRVFAGVYAELRGIAHRRLATERDGHTLSTTALVHEVYIKLAGQRSGEYKNRGQFFALAAQAMRRILVDYARRHRALKRSNLDLQVSLSALESTDGASAVASVAERSEFLVALDDALEELRALDPRLGSVIEYRFFVGLTEPETAELLGVTQRTVARDWVRARGWLYQRLRNASGESDAGHQ